jgi:chromosome partitioning protein
MKSDGSGVKVVVLYNHKGGVSKTTTTFNVASLLAERGSKVLMIDADPQCNLTQVALAPVIDDLDAKSLKDKKIYELPGTSLLDVLNQRIRGDAAYIDIKKIELCSVSSNLFLLRGSVDLSSVEDDLAEAHLQRMSQRTNLMRTYVAINDFIQRLASSKGIDYVFIDVGPSAGALTRAFFLSADMFFVPVAPDRFNVQAMATLSNILDRWYSEHGAIIEVYRGLHLPVKERLPVFLGAIVQAFKTYKGQPKPAFKLWQSRIPLEIRKKLKLVLERHSTDGMKLFPLAAKGEVVTSIPDFGQLAPLMQEVGKPVFQISKEDTARITESGLPWTGNNWTSAQERMATYRHCFEAVANLIEGWKP